MSTGSQQTWFGYLDKCTQEYIRALESRASKLEQAARNVVEGHNAFIETGFDEALVEPMAELEALLSAQSGMPRED